MNREHYITYGTQYSGYFLTTILQDLFTKKAAFQNTQQRLRYVVQNNL